MKKYVYTALLAVGLSVPAFAGVSTQHNTLGQEANPQFSGVGSCQIGNSTGTAAVLCASGSGIILQVIGSSIGATDYVAFRDTSIANTSSAELLRFAQGGSYIPVGGLIYPRFKNGLSANASVAPGATTGMWTIVYTKDLN